MVEHLPQWVEMEGQAGQEQSAMMGSDWVVKVSSRSCWCLRVQAEVKRLGMGFESDSDPKRR